MPASAGALPPKSWRRIADRLGCRPRWRLCSESTEIQPKLFPARRSYGFRLVRECHPTVRPRYRKGCPIPHEPPVRPRSDLDSSFASMTQGCERAEDRVRGKVWECNPSLSESL